MAVVMQSLFVVLVCDVRKFTQLSGDGVIWGGGGRGLFAVINNVEICRHEIWTFLGHILLDKHTCMTMYIIKFKINNF